eukprot:236071_1
MATNIILFVLLSIIPMAKPTDYSVAFTVSNSDIYSTATANDVYFSLCDSNDNCGSFITVQGGWNTKGATYSYTYSTNNFVNNVAKIYVAIRGSDNLCLKRVTVNGQRYDTPDDLFGTNIPVCIENDNAVCDIMLITLSNNGWSEPPCTFTSNQLLDITKQPSRQPSKQPSKYPTQYPTEIPSISHAEYSTMQPTYMTTSYTTLNSLNESLEASKINTQTTNDMLTHFTESQRRLILITSITCVSLFVICLVYLLVFTRKRAQKFGQMTKLDFFKQTGCLFKIGIVFSFADIITDYL